MALMDKCKLFLLKVENQMISDLEKVADPMEQEELKILKERLLNIKNKQDVIDELEDLLKKAEEALENEKEAATNNLDPQQYSERLKDLLSLNEKIIGEHQEIFQLERLKNQQLIKWKKSFNKRKNEIESDASSDEMPNDQPDTEFVPEETNGVESDYTHASKLKEVAKKVQLERQQHMILWLQEAFMHGYFLSRFKNEDVRRDFLSGEKGAVQLTDEQLYQLDQLSKLIRPGQPTEQSDITSHYYVLAENNFFLVQGKNEEIAGTTYKTLKELLVKIKECGYFSGPTYPVDDSDYDEMPNGQPDKLDPNNKLNMLLNQKTISLNLWNHLLVHKVLHCKRCLNSRDLSISFKNHRLTLTLHT